MKDNRKSMKMAPIVKENIESLRKELGFRTESHVLAYLVAMYRDQKRKTITLGDHQKYVSHSEEIHNQKSI